MAPGCNYNVRAMKLAATDHRGRAVALRMGEPMAFWPGSEMDRHARATMRTAVQRTFNKPQTAAVMIAISAALLVLLGVLPMLMRTLEGNPAAGMGVLVLAPFTGFALLTAWRLWCGEPTLTDSETYIHMMLRAGLCPGCSYGLAGLAREDDGCVVCPECGGAWMLPVSAHLPGRNAR